MKLSYWVLEITTKTDICQEIDVYKNMGVQIKTFVFFDLETTGMFEGTVAPKITEMALIAVARESICNNNQNPLPRILHKLVLPVNPKKIIPVKVQYMTKIYNDDMQLLEPFELGIYELLIYFLRRLRPPICFVAHNGNLFDYPILLSELKCINKVLDDTILCIDTYQMFRNYFQEISSNTTPHALHIAEIDDLLNDGYNESLSAVLDSVMIEKEIRVQNAATTSLERLPYENRYIKALNSKHDANETHNTVDSKHDANKTHNTVDSSLQNYKIQDNQKTPTSQITKQQDIIDRPFKKNNYRRKLKFGSEKTSPINFKLPSIYKHMFNSSIEDAHSAEADCLAMLRCVTQITDYFLAWSGDNASPLVRYERAQ